MGNVNLTTEVVPAPLRLAQTTLNSFEVMAKIAATRARSGQRKGAWLIFLPILPAEYFYLFEKCLHLHPS